MDLTKSIGKQAIIKQFAGRERKPGLEERRIPMPATYTHAVYGQMVLDRLDPALRRRLEAWRPCYDIGLSGPDILFFYKPLSQNPVKALGYGMHQKPARPFFQQARSRIAASRNPEAALAYILGFLNHFVLDSQCHPWINRMEKELPASHSHLESELDAVLMRERGLDPSRTRVAEHIHPSRENAQVIAPFFQMETGEPVKPGQVEKALRTMKRVLNLFVAPGRAKQGVIRAGLRLAGQYEGLEGLMIRRQADPACATFCRTLRQDMEEAVPVSCRLIQEFLEKQEGKEPLDPRYDRTYE